MARRRRQPGGAIGRFIGRVTPWDRPLVGTRPAQSTARALSTLASPQVFPAAGPALGIAALAARRSATAPRVSAPSPAPPPAPVPSPANFSLGRALGTAAIGGLRSLLTDETVRGGGGGGDIGGVSATYRQTYEAALARQRAAVEDEFRRALEEIARREQRGMGLVAEHAAAIAPSFAATRQGLQQFTAGTTAAQAASGLPRFGTPESSLAPFLAASQAGEQAAQREVGFLRSGVGEVASRQRTQADLARAEALTGVERQATEQEMALQRMLLQAEIAADAESRRLRAAAKADPMLPYRIQEAQLQNELLRRRVEGENEWDRLADTSGLVNPYRGRAEAERGKDYRNNPIYKNFSTTWRDDILPQSRDLQEAIRRFVSLPDAQQYYLIASRWLYDVFGLPDTAGS